MRVNRQVIGLIACAATASNAAAESASAVLQEQVLAAARRVTAEDYAFTRTVRSEQFEGEKVTKRVEVERYDPANQPSRRWSLTSIDGRAPTAEELKEHAAEAPKRRVAHYGRVAIYFAAAATASSDAKGRTVFHFASLPNESLIISGNDVSANASCEAAVNTSGAVPFVEEARFTLLRPTRVKLVARVDRAEVVQRFRLMPNGKPVVIEHVSDLYGSLMGHHGRIRTVLTYSDHALRGAK